MQNIMIKQIVVVMMVMLVASRTLTLCVAANEESNRRVIFSANASMQPNSINEFAWNLFRESKPVDSLSNLVLSPMAIQYQLSLLELGAAGETKTQLQNVAGVGQLARIHTLLHPNASSNRNAEGTEIFSADGIFIDKQLSLNQTYQTLVISLGGAVYNVGFTSQPTEAKNLINSWISRRTSGNIQKMLNDDFDVSGVAVLLASALYFRSSWRYKMSPSDPRLFFTDTNNSGYLTEYMEIKQHFNYDRIYFDKKFVGELVELPYADGAYSMILLIPNRNTPINTFIKQIDAKSFDAIMKNSNERNSLHMKLIMPKFKATSRFSLVNALLKMGLIDTFSGSSNLPYMAKNAGPIILSDILQQATLDVNENGTIASAATVTFLIPLSAVNELEMIIDRPFVSIIFDKKNQCPLFISKIMRPTSVSV